MSANKEKQKHYQSDSDNCDDALNDLPPMYAIVLHNDDKTTIEFVIWVLMQVLNLRQDTAYNLTMEIHLMGQASVAVLPKEIAEMQAEKIRFLAKQERFPLLVTLEAT